MANNYMIWYRPSSISREIVVNYNVIPAHLHQEAKMKKTDKPCEARM